MTTAANFEFPDEIVSRILDFLFRMCKDRIPRWRWDVQLVSKQFYRCFEPLPFRAVNISNDAQLSRIQITADSITGCTIESLVNTYARYLMVPEVEALSSNGLTALGVKCQNLLSFRIHKPTVGRSDNILSILSVVCLQCPRLCRVAATLDAVQFFNLIESISQADEELMKLFRHRLTHLELDRGHRDAALDKTHFSRYPNLTHLLLYVDRSDYMHQEQARMEIATGIQHDLACFPSALQRYLVVFEDVTKSVSCALLFPEGEFRGKDITEMKSPEVVLGMYHPFIQDEHISKLVPNLIVDNVFDWFWETTESVLTDVDIWEAVDKVVTARN